MSYLYGVRGRRSGRTNRRKSYQDASKDEELAKETPSPEGLTAGKPQPGAATLRQALDRGSLPLSLFADVGAAVAVLREAGTLLLVTVLVLAVAMSSSSFFLYLKRGHRGRAVIGAVSLGVALSVATWAAAGGAQADTETAAFREGLVTAYTSVAARPNAADIDRILEEYFASINSHDYARWSEVVTPVMVGRLAEGDWYRAYKTTRVGEAQIVALDGGGEGAAATVRYTSYQAVEDAPAGLPAPVICWTSRFSFDTSGGTMKLNVVSTTMNAGPC